MAIQDDNTILSKADLKAYHQKILPFLGGNAFLSTSHSDYYSTDEKMVGVWTNGKPLYQKTFSGNCNGGNAMTAIATNVKSSLNIEEVVDFRGSVNYNSSGGWLPLTYAWVPSNNDYQTAYLSGDGTLYCGGKYSGKTIITIQYTKTTDTASTALTTPGAYDINRPDLWPANKEIFFGDGLYGQRFTGTISVNSTSVSTKTLINSDCSNYKFKMQGGDIYRANGTHLPFVGGDVDQPPLTYNFFILNSGSGGYLLLRGRDNTTATVTYDIWATYTK